MRIATGDFETDPFEAGATIKPFCIGTMLDDGTYWDHWGDDAPEAFVNHIAENKEPTIYYFHNGGNFDFYFLMPWIDGDISLINSRIVKCFIGIHELRDSYAIFPDPLSAYKKDDLTDDDYKIKFRKDNRENYRDFILGYQKRDCGYLLEAVLHFHERFGDHLTIGSCAMKQLKKVHKFETANERFHEKFSHFYFGGRNQCFETGVIAGRFSLYDINSQYPSVMRNFRHPIGCSFSVGRDIGPHTFFAEIEAINRGCLPQRVNGRLDFTIERGTFHAGIHEIKAGLETGTLEILRIHATYDFVQSCTFQEFIDKFYDLRIDARRRNDALDNLFYKRIMNSCYGKFAQNPGNYMDYIITHGEKPDEEGYSLHKTNGDYYIWERPASHKTYYNIATGASITSAARSLLLRGLSSVGRPLYVDTDSILCAEVTDKLPISGSILGQWKHEGDFSRVAIAGKKLYACFVNEPSPLDDKGLPRYTNIIDENGSIWHCPKKAHKGAKLTGEEILRIAEGDTIEYASPAPKFRLDGTTVYVRRRIKRTA